MRSCVGCPRRVAPVGGSGRCPSGAEMAHQFSAAWQLVGWKRRQALDQAHPSCGRGVQIPRCRGHGGRAGTGPNCGDCIGGVGTFGGALIQQATDRRRLIGSCLRRHLGGRLANPGCRGRRGYCSSSRRLVFPAAQRLGRGVRIQQEKQHAGDNQDHQGDRGDHRSSDQVTGRRGPRNTGRTNRWRPSDRFG